MNQAMIRANHEGLQSFAITAAFQKVRLHPLPIDEYKDLWEYKDGINFRF
jgi:hypothetical protein